MDLVMNIQMDKKGGAPVTHFKSREVIDTYLKETEMVDILRLQHPQDFQFTWKRLGDSPIFCRLDMIFLSEDMINNTEKSDILPGFKSDHSMTSAMVDFDRQSRGKGFWKLNTNLLCDKDYVECINKSIDASKVNHSSESPDMKWELIKCDAIGESMKYSFQKSKSRNNILEVLDKKIKRLEHDLSNEKDKYKVNRIGKDLNSTKNEYQNIMFEKTKGSMFRSRARWHEEGEKSSKYFLNLEKFRYDKKTIKSMYLSDGSLTKDPSKILDEIWNFYSRLLTTDSSIKFDMVNNEDTKISDVNKNLVDKNITIQELGLSLKSMANGKTPGCDGLPVDFYKMFWEKTQDTPF